MSHPARTARRPLVSLLATLLAGLLAVVAGCGSSDSSSTDRLPSTTSASTSSTAGSAASSTTSTRPSTVINLTIAGGKVSGGVSRHGVTLGDEVILRVTSDVDEELHVHGYDHKVELLAGTPAELSFTADIPGVFEVELEQSGRKVAELQVA